ncbi:MAG: VanZ family protein [Armatimonadota bacterium]
MAPNLSTMIASRNRMAWVLVSLWMAVIAWGSLAPGVGISPGPDSLIHGWAYLVLAWLLRGAMTQSGFSRSLILPAVLAWGFGLLMEGLQLMLPFRSGEIRDLIANAVGAGVAMTLPVPRSAGTDVR